MTATTLPIVAISQAGAALPQPGVLRPALSLCRRELVRFLRQRHRIIGALGTPIVVWLLFGLGMGHSFQGINVPGGANYLQYFFPGTVLMILLFTAIFSTISIIEDRREGFLQSVLVAPVSRMAIVLGKLLGGAGLAFIQAALFMLLAPIIGLRVSPMGVVEACTMMLIIAFALTGLGFLIAWRMTSTQGFHAIMNLFLMPLWFLSGAMFAPQTAWTGLRWVMRFNPLSYGLAGLQRAVFPPDSVKALPSWPVILIVSGAFAVLMVAMCTRLASRGSAADLH